MNVISGVDETDKEIILAITKGHSSPYSIWSILNKQAQGRGMAYINIKKRVLRLAGMELLQREKEKQKEKGKSNTDLNPNIHNRKDYKVTMKGLLFLEDHIIKHPEDIKNIAEYMSKAKLDERELTKLLNDRVSSTIYSVNLYRNIIGLDSFELEYNEKGQIMKFIDGRPISSQKKKR